MVCDEFERLQMHQQINAFARASCTFGKNLATIAKDVDSTRQAIPFFFFLNSIV